MNHYIKWIQETLVTLGYDPGVIDGINGPHTQTAIKAFQSDHHLVVDGMVGAETQRALMANWKATMFTACFGRLKNMCFMLMVSRPGRWKKPYRTPQNSLF